jgi:hypothetical protein
MLFDLKGKRRRTVQVTYLALAVLMGAGLVLFGIGSSVNGGLGDLFKGGNGSNKANETIQKRIDAAQRTLQRDPRNAAALSQVIKGHYQLATATADPSTSEFTKGSRKELVLTTQAWKRYEGAVKKPDPAVVNTVLQAYDGLGRLDSGDAAKGDWKGASDAAETAAAAKPSPQAYLLLVQYATLAGNIPKADLAGQTAVRVAKPGLRKQVKAAVAQTKQQALKQSQQGSAGGQTAPSPSG